jgi:hypothetical protein
MHAEILLFRARGVFAGIALDGATLRPDDDSNVELYPTKPTNKEIVLGKTEVPAASSELVAALNRYSVSSQANRPLIDWTRAWVSIERLDTSFQPGVFDVRDKGIHPRHAAAGDVRRCAMRHPSFGDGNKHNLFHPTQDLSRDQDIPHHPTFPHHCGEWFCLDRHLKSP